MQYATCAANGGDLIHASKANHDSFRTLITRCPCCGEPVTWRQGHTRCLSNGQLVEVAPAFIHRKAIEPLIIQECELRVNNFTYQDIKRYASEARQQRWIVLRQHFWKMLLTSKVFNHPVIYEIAERLRKEAVPDEKFYSLLKADSNEFIQILKPSELRYKILWSAHDTAYEQMQHECNQTNYILRVIEESVSDLENLENLSFLSQESKNEYQKYFNNWDKKYYEATTKEIFNFLCSTQSRDLFREVLYFIMAQILSERPDLQALEFDSDMGWIGVHINLSHFAMRKLTEVLLMIDWRVEFIKRFELSRKGSDIS